MTHPSAAYAATANQLAQRLRADTVVVLVVGGKSGTGSGFAVADPIMADTGDDPVLQELALATRRELVALLRSMLDEFEREMGLP